MESSILSILNSKKYTQKKSHSSEIIRVATFPFNYKTKAKDKIKMREDIKNQKKMDLNLTL
jgi:hypothetical protein